MAEYKQIQVTTTLLESQLEDLKLRAAKHKLTISQYLRLVLGFGMTLPKGRRPKKGKE